RRSFRAGSGLADGDAEILSAAGADDPAGHHARDGGAAQVGRSRSLRTRPRAARAGSAQLLASGVGGRELDRHRRRAGERRDRRGDLRRRVVTPRAAVPARFSAPPAALSARAHALSVAPVVLTSSTTTTILLASIRPRRVGANASRTLR